MKKKIKEDNNKQIVEIHIYIHQDNIGMGCAPYIPQVTTPQPCPMCGRYGPHTCVTSTC